MTKNQLDPLTLTVEEIQRQLSSGQTSSGALVKLYRDQISKHNGRLKAVWSLAADAVLDKRISELDQERSQGRIRGPLHGVPVLIKDNIATDADYNLDTTAGSLALVGAVAPESADLVKHLEYEGAILLGKTTLSELAFWKGYGLNCAWSAVAGQGQSAYVQGGVDPDDTFAGHSNPGGSSSGSAISVSAGFAPITYGTETDGSLVMPGNRASVYTIKPTVGKFSTRGIVPFHPKFDTPGPMAKTPVDLAIGLDAIAGPVGERKERAYAEAANNTSWKDLRVGLLDPTTWKQPPHMIKPVTSASEQMVREINNAYDRLEKAVKVSHRNIDWIQPSDVAQTGSMLMDLWKHGFKRAFNSYVENLDSAHIKDLQDLIKFNQENAEQELPPENPNQDALIASLNPNLSDDEAEQRFKEVCWRGREGGIDAALSRYDIDVIIGPGDSPVTKLASAAGYPIATLPLSYLDFNGRPFGLVALASSNQEDVLFRVMGAWESTFSPRKPPPMLVNSNGPSPGASL